MSKNQKSKNFFLENKKILFLAIVLGTVLIFTIIIFSTILYNDYKLDVYKEEGYKKTSMSKIEKNFDIQEFYVKQFYLTKDDELINNGKIKFSINIGQLKNDNIEEDSLKIKTTIAYNWYGDAIEKSYSTDLDFNEGSTTYTMFNIDVTPLKDKPHWFVSSSVKKIKFYSNFSWTEEHDGELIEKNYYIIQDYDDLITKDTSFLG